MELLFGAVLGTALKTTKTNALKDNKNH